MFDLGSLELLRMCVSAVSYVNDVCVLRMKELRFAKAQWKVIAEEMTGCSE